MGRRKGSKNKPRSEYACSGAAASHNNEYGIEHTTPFSIAKLRKFNEALRWPEKLPIIQWAENNYVLSRSFADDSGPFRISRVPHVRSILEEVERGEIHEYSLVFASQTQKSTMLEIILCYIMDCQPRPAMWVHPTATARNRWVDTRLSSVIQSSPRMSELLRGGADSITHTMVRFLTAPLFLSLSDSESDLSQVSVGAVFCDEIDKYEMRTRREGSPIDQAKARMRTFRDWLLFLSSTPTTGDGHIWRSYMSSDMRTWRVPCPGCGVYMLWSHRDLYPKPEPECDLAQMISDIKSNTITSYWKCPLCGREVSKQSEHDEMNLAGVFHKGNENIKHHAGFQFPALGSTFPGGSFGSIHALWLEAKLAISRGNQEPLKTFLQHQLAEPWQEYSKRTDEESVVSRAVDIPRGVVPIRCDVVTVFIDVQDDCVYWMACGWGRAGVKCHVIDWGKIPGKIEDIYNELDGLVVTKWSWQDNTKHMPASIVMMDSGSGVHARAVYRWCLRHRQHVIPSKGTERTSGGVMVAKGRANESEHGGRLVLLGTVELKDTFALLMDRPVNSEHPVSFCSDARIDKKLQSHMVSEQRVVTSTQRGNKRAVWELRSGHSANHWFDCAIGCLAGAVLCGVFANAARPQRKQISVVGSPFLQR